MITKATTFPLDTLRRYDRDVKARVYFTEIALGDRELLARRVRLIRAWAKQRRATWRAGHVKVRERWS